MANVLAGYTTISSSLSGYPTSTPIALDPTARTTTVQLYTGGLLSGTSTASDVTIQVTYDSWVPTGAVTQTWVSLTTAHYSSATDASTAADGTGIVLTVTGPIAGLRLASSAWFGHTAITLQALQSITAGP